MNPKLARRHILQALGLTGASYFLPSLLPRSARAAGSTVPKRLVIFWTPHGTQPQFWPTGSQSAFTLGAIHQPLQAFQNDLIFLEGLDFGGQRYVNPNIACGHAYGTVQSLTGNYQVTTTNDGDQWLNRSLSIDQYILQQWKAQNGGVSPTALAGLYLACMDTENFYYQDPFYSGPSSPVPQSIDPVAVYNQQLFPGSVVAPPGSTAAATTLARRQAVLNFASSEYATAKAHLGALERARLDQHASYISDLSKSLSTASAVTCTPPGAPQAGNGFNYHVSTMIQEIQVALACDITRVVGFNIDQVPEPLVGFNAGDYGQPDIHQLIHATDREGPLAGNAAAVNVITNFHLVYANIFAQLLTALKSVTEPDGSTLLQNTAVLWCGEIAEGNHGVYGAHWLLAGQCGGTLKTGQMFQFGDPLRSEETFSSSAPTINDLFCSLATKLGVPTNTFGYAQACNGPIAGL